MYTTSKYLVSFVMLYSARDQNIGHQEVGGCNMTMQQLISSKWFKLSATNTTVHCNDRLSTLPTFLAVTHAKTLLKGTQFESQDDTVSLTHVWPTLHEDALHPHKQKHVQKLHPEHSAMHLQFFHWLHTNRQVLPLILFTDEATSTHYGINTLHINVWQTSEGKQGTQWISPTEAWHV